MIKKWLFYIVLLATALILLFYSNMKQDKSYAVMAEVESMKTAISFHKPVRVKELLVQPGAHVKKCDLMLVVERADLELDIQLVNNTLVLLDNQLSEIDTRYASNMRIEKLQYEQKVSDLLLKINTNTEKIKRDSIFYNQIVSNKSKNALDATPEKLLIASLKEEQMMLKQTYNAANSRAQAIYLAEREAIALKQAGLRDELTSLQTEKQNLRQYAPFDGTIGEVSVQLMELVPPFQTIISVYDDHPHIIKGYMNERGELTAKVGQKVAVTSSNRKYEIPGEVIEVGSRIVSIPLQMNPIAQLPLWGREVFVKISKQNEFLNGEKVYVVFKED